MLEKILKSLESYPRWHTRILRSSYNLISSFDRRANLRFMNLGYADLDSKDVNSKVDEEEEFHRFGIRLYQHVADTIDWKGLRGLEIGSGRGGGVANIKHDQKPDSLIGLDLADKTVEFCHTHYDMNGLYFIQGNALHLPFCDNSFDVIINIESALHYSDDTGFLSEVVRVLKPNGFFLYADLRTRDDLSKIRGLVQQLGLLCLREENITENVLHALNLDNTRKQQFIRRYVPFLFRRIVYEIAGMRGTNLIYNRLLQGELVYFNFILKKTVTDYPSPKGLL